ncbi:hypothetical protein FHG87_019012 [Trinorchestia longiramus]|nr:hypothetical protein FHG87_019012 [Trinorchestia longiramus]
MPSDAKKKREQKKKAASKASSKPAANKTSSQTSAKNSEAASNGVSNGTQLSAEELLCLKFEEDMKMAAESRSATGVRAIHPRARDVKIDGFSITYHGSEMLKDTKLELSCGNRFVIIIF